MNYRVNRTYFKPRKALGYIGGGFFLLAVPLLIFFRFFGFVSLIIGAACVLVNRELNVRFSDVEEQIKGETDRLASELEDRYLDVKHPEPKMEITVIGDFLTEGEGLLTRRGALGKCVTSRYRVAAVGIRGERLYFLAECFSIVDDEGVSVSEGEYDFSEIDRIEYGTVEGAAIPHSEFAIITKSGEEVLRVPAPTDYGTEKYVEDLNVSFARVRAEERREDKTI